MASFTTPRFFRGQSIQFATTFFDFNGNVTQPAAALINLAFQDGTTTQIPMQSPIGQAVQWTAVWDSRNSAAPSIVSWSIHSVPPTPCSVEDGMFELTANPANLATF